MPTLTTYCTLSKYTPLFPCFFLPSRLLSPPSSSLPHTLFPPFLFSPLPPYFLMLSPFFLSLAFLPLLLPFPYLNFPIPSFTFPTFPFLHIHPDFSTLLLTITFPLGLFLPSAILLPYASSHSVLHLLFLSAHFRFFPLYYCYFNFYPFPLSGSPSFSTFLFLPFSHPLLLLPTFSLFLLQLFMFSPFLRSQLRSTFTPTYTFPTFFSALQFCHTFSTPPFSIPSPFSLLAFSPQLPFSFLFRTNFSLPPFLLFFSASAISLSHTFIPFPCLNFFHILPHFPHPDVFPFPPYLRPLMPAVFFTLQGQGKKSKNTIFYCTIKTFSLDYFAVHGIFSLPASI